MGKSRENQKENKNENHEEKSKMTTKTKHQSQNQRLLELKNVNKSFGDVRVLNGVNFSLSQGQVYTLRGGNGSGKTTLINIISGFLKPDGGKVEFKGRQFNRFAPYRVNRLGVGRTFQDLRLATQMTVYENILLAMERKMFARPTREQQQRADEILDKVSLTEKRNERAGEISYGQQKLLTIGCCIANTQCLRHCRKH
jgi:branched-chain amino acid transport system ATP-binding protein